MSDLKVFKELQSEQEIFIGHVSSTVKEYKQMKEPFNEVTIWDIRNKYGSRVSHAVTISYDYYQVLEQNGIVGEDGVIIFRGDLSFKNIKFAQYKTLEI